MGSGKAGKSNAQKPRGGEATAMDVDGDNSNPEQPKFSVNVLQLIKTAQSQHGLRHNDYTRYRKYCSARLRRLYKSLKFTHGRGKFSKRTITESTITDVRFLHIVIYMAERAWAYAMEKKNISRGPNSKQRIYLLGRLRKATKWADLLACLCKKKADCKTSLEATAYASYMRGRLLFEREENWEKALLYFKTSRIVYDQLGKYGDTEDQTLCRNCVEELDPNIRYCLYKLGQPNMESAEDWNLNDQDLPGIDVLKENLEAVRTEGKVQHTSSNSDFHMLGRRFLIRNAKTRTFLLRAQQLEKNLNASTSGSTAVEKKVAIFDKIFSAYHDARRHIREDLATVGDMEDEKVILTGLDKAIGCALLQRTMERNQLLVQIALHKIAQQEANECKLEKLTKPEELVRLFDTLVQNATDLSDLVASGRDRTDQEALYAEELTAKGLYFQAQRCFYLAKSYSQSGKHTEAYALYSRACEHVTLATKAYEKLKNPDSASVKELGDLNEKCRSEMCIEHAAGVAEARKAQEAISDNISAMTLSEREKSRLKFLTESLDAYDSAVGTMDSKEPPRIAKFPPEFLSVPCKPIILDTAINSIEFPSLENRLKREGKRSVFGRWWR